MELRLPPRVARVAPLRAAPPRRVAPAACAAGLAARRIFAFTGLRGGLRPTSPAAADLGTAAGA